MVHGNTLNILFVEHNPDDVILVRRVLRNSGVLATVWQADTARDIADALRAVRFDLLLCDYAMPVLDVAEVLSLVGNLAVGVPCVLLSGAVGEEAIADLMRMGFIDVVLKDRMADRLPSVVQREATRARREMSHHRLREGVASLLMCFDARTNWHRATVLSLDHILASFAATAAVMLEAPGLHAPLQVVGWAAAPEATAPDTIPLQVLGLEGGLRQSILSNKVVAASCGGDGAGGIVTQVDGASVVLPGYSYLFCEPFRLGDAAFGLVVLFAGPVANPAALAAELNLAAGLLQPALMIKRLHHEWDIMRQALDSVHTGVLLTDATIDAPGPRIVYANRAIAEMAGYTTHELLNATPRIFQGPQTNPAALAYIRAGLVAAAPVHVDIINYRKDGTSFEAELNITPVSDEGRVTHFMSIQRDVTRSRHYERERAEREAEVHALRLQTEATLQSARQRAEAAEVFLRDAMESISEGIVIFDVNDRLVLCNEQYRAAFCIGLDTVPGKTSYDDVIHAFLLSGGDSGAKTEPPDDFTSKRRRVYRAAAGSIEYRNGEGRWFHATDRRMQDGSTVGLRVDITALRTAQDALEESQKRFQQVLDGIRETFWIIDLAKQEFIFLNRAYEVIRGNDRETIYSTLGIWLQSVHTDDRAMLAHAVKCLPESGGYELEYRVLRPDGSIRWLHERAYSINDGPGSAIFAGVGEDITERRHYEAQRHAAQKMEALGGLVGGMAHDFNNILGVVMGSLDLLKRHAGGDRLTGELCDEALLGAQHGAELIKSLLSFARRQSLHPQAINANVLIGMMTELIRRSLGEAIRLRNILAPDVWYVFADPVQLETALLNFATNARDAMPRGGTLTLTTRNASLVAGDAELTTECQPGDYVVVEVQDTGTGIAPEVINQIFEPFFTTKSHGHGTGLGLAMIYGFARQSGGQLLVTSELDHGSTFRLYLPRTTEKPAELVYSSPDAPVVGGHETVLVVEDNTQLRRATCAQLAELGYHVLQAEDANSAITLLGCAAQVDLLFTDIVLPDGTDGLALAEMVGRHKPGIAILLTSGFPDVPNADDRILDAALTTLPKPYSGHSLADAVRKALDQAQRYVSFEPP